MAEPTSARATSDRDRGLSLPPPAPTVPPLQLAAERLGRIYLEASRAGLPFGEWADPSLNSISNGIATRLLLFSAVYGGPGYGGLDAGLAAYRRDFELVRVKVAPWAENAIWKIYARLKALRQKLQQESVQRQIAGEAAIAYAEAWRTWAVDWNDPLNPYTDEWPGHLQGWVNTVGGPELRALYLHPEGAGLTFTLAYEITMGPARVTALLDEGLEALSQLAQNVYQNSRQIWKLRPLVLAGARALGVASAPGFSDYLRVVAPVVAGSPWERALQRGLGTLAVFCGVILFIEFPALVVSAPEILAELLGSAGASASAGGAAEAGEAALGVAKAAVDLAAAGTSTFTSFSHMLEVRLALRAQQFGDGTAPLRGEDPPGKAGGSRQPPPNPLQPRARPPQTARRPMAGAVPPEPAPGPLTDETDPGLPIMDAVNLVVAGYGLLSAGKAAFAVAAKVKPAAPPIKQPPGAPAIEKPPPVVVPAPAGEGSSTVKLAGDEQLSPTVTNAPTPARTRPDFVKPEPSAEDTGRLEAMQSPANEPDWHAVRDARGVDPGTAPEQPMVITGNLGNKRAPDPVPAAPTARKPESVALAQARSLDRLAEDGTEVTAHPPAPASQRDSIPERAWKEAIKQETEAILARTKSPSKATADERAAAKVEAIKNLPRPATSSSAELDMENWATEYVRGATPSPRQSKRARSMLKPGNPDPMFGGGAEPVPVNLVDAGHLIGVKEAQSLPFMEGLDEYRVAKLLDFNENIEPQSVKFNRSLQDTPLADYRGVAGAKLGSIKYPVDPKALSGLIDRRAAALKLLEQRVAEMRAKDAADFANWQKTRGLPTGE